MPAGELGCNWGEIIARVLNKKEHVRMNISFDQNLRTQGFSLRRTTDSMIRIRVGEEVGSDFCNPERPHAYAA